MNIHDKWMLVTGIFVGCYAGGVLAEEMITDRPDATESSSVVQPGFVQGELGWLYTKNEDVRAHEVPQMLFRIGVIERVELRLGWAGYQAVNGSGGADGVGDFELGAKVFLAEEQGAFPEMALLGAVSMPSGDDDVSSGEFDPSFRFAFSHTLSDTFSLGYNLGAEWETEVDSMLSSFVYTAALGAGLSDAIGAFVEVFGDVGMSASGEAHSFDGGLTYLLRENLQLDAYAGVGLSDGADDWFAGTGISFRFPN
ncbi:MAG: transporter [Pontiella sp.]